MNPPGSTKEKYWRSRSADLGVRLRPVFEDFHRLKMSAAYEYPRHQHTNYEVILVEKGIYRCTLNGEELTLAPSQVLIVKPGDWHQDHLRAGQRHYVLHFRLEAPLPGSPVVPLFHADVSPQAQLCTGNYARDAFFLRELRREAELGAVHAGAVQDCLLEAWFWRLARGLAPTALSPGFRRLPGTEARRELLAGVFQRHLRMNPTVLELAAAAHMSPRKFTADCTTLLGRGPARWLLELKLRHAHELLLHRQWRVNEVSEFLGFANPFHFSRVYKRVHGRAPSVR